MVSWPNVTSLATAYVASIAVVWSVLVLGRRFAWVAEMNERSFHATPTPTLGGLGLLLPGVIATFYVALSGNPLFLGLGVASLLVGAVSLWDDLEPISWWIRLAAHGLGSGLVGCSRSAALLPTIGC